jgi:MFS family permease
MVEDSNYEDSVRQVIARINRIPTWSLPTYFLGIIGLGYFFTFYDIADIGLTMPAIATQFNISLTGFTSLFLALAIGLIGYAIGSYVIGSLADLAGRYRTMILTMGLTALGSFGDALSVNIPMLVLFRFITGLGLGADLNLVSGYVSEFAPAQSRGKITVYTFLLGILGQAVTPFIALGIGVNVTTGPGWRYLFVIGGIIAIIALVMRFELPESPRWLAMRKRDIKGAEKVLDSMEKLAVSKVGKLPEPKPQDVVIYENKFPTKYLFKKPYSTRLGILAAMWFLWYIGNYGFLGDAATLISSLNTSVSPNAILYIAVGALGYPVGAIIMLFVADRYERKFVILGDTVVWLIGMLIFSTATPDALFIGSFLASLALGMYLQVAYTYTAESYPTRARTSGFALTDGIGHGGGALGAILLPVIVSSYSFATGFIFIGITGLLAGIIAIAGPKASKQALEEVSA